MNQKGIGWKGRCRNGFTASVLGRVPARQYPATADFQGIWIVIQMQSRDGCPSDRRQANYSYSVGTPVKMRKPVLRPWVEQRFHPTRLGILGRRSIGLVPIT
jgi:hypothetical protein